MDDESPRVSDEYKEPCGDFQSQLYRSDKCRVCFFLKGKHLQQYSETSAPTEELDMDDPSIDTEIVETNEIVIENIETKQEDQVTTELSSTEHSDPSPESLATKQSTNIKDDHIEIQKEVKNGTGKSESTPAVQTSFATTEDPAVTFKAPTLKKRLSRIYVKTPKYKRVKSNSMIIEPGELRLPHTESKHEPTKAPSQSPPPIPVRNIVTTKEEKIEEALSSWMGAANNKPDALTHSKKQKIKKGRTLFRASRKHTVTETSAVQARQAKSDPEPEPLRIRHSFSSLSVAQNPAVLRVSLFSFSFDHPEQVPSLLLKDGIGIQFSLKEHGDIAVKTKVIPIGEGEVAPSQWIFCVSSAMLLQQVNLDISIQDFIVGIDIGSISIPLQSLPYVHSSMSFGSVSKMSWKSATSVTGKVTLGLKLTKAKSVCNVNSSWDEETNGGAMNFPTWEQSPQFSFAIHQNMVCNLSLYSEVGKIERIGFYLFLLRKGDNGTVVDPFRVNNSNLYHVEQCTKKFGTATHATLELYLLAGSYVILPCSFVPFLSGDFQFSISSTSGLEVPTLHYLEAPIPVQMESEGEEVAKENEPETFVDGFDLSDMLSFTLKEADDVGSLDWDMDLEDDSTSLAPGKMRVSSTPNLRSPRKPKPPDNQEDLGFDDDFVCTSPCFTAPRKKSSKKNNDEDESFDDGFGDEFDLPLSNSTTNSLKHAKGDNDDDGFGDDFDDGFGDGFEDDLGSSLKQKNDECDDGFGDGFDDGFGDDFGDSLGSSLTKKNGEFDDGFDDGFGDDLNSSLKQKNDECDDGFGDGFDDGFGDEFNLPLSNSITNSLKRAKGDNDDDGFGDGFEDDLGSSLKQKNDECDDGFGDGFDDGFGDDFGDSLSSSLKKKNEKCDDEFADGFGDELGSLVKNDECDGSGDIGSASKKCRNNEEFDDGFGEIVGGFGKEKEKQKDEGSLDDFESPAGVSIFSVLENESLARLFSLVKEDPSLVASRNENGETPLLLAIKNSQMDIIACLLRNEADPDASNSSGEFPILLAIEKEMVDTVAILMRNHCSLSIGGIFAPLFAIEKGNQKIIKQIETSTATLSSMEFGAKNQGAEWDVFSFFTENTLQKEGDILPFEFLDIVEILHEHNGQLYRFQASIYGDSLFSAALIQEKKKSDVIVPTLSLFTCFGIAIREMIDNGDISPTFGALDSQSAPYCDKYYFLNEMDTKNWSNGPNDDLSRPIHLLSDPVMPRQKMLHLDLVNYIRFTQKDCRHLEPIVHAGKFKKTVGLFSQWSSCLHKKVLNKKARFYFRLHEFRNLSKKAKCDIYFSVRVGIQEHRSLPKKYKDTSILLEGLWEVDLEENFQLVVYCKTKTVNSKLLSRTDAVKLKELQIAKGSHHSDWVTLEHVEIFATFGIAGYE